MPNFIRRAVIAVCFLSTISAVAVAQKFDEKFDLWPLDLKINGTIIAANALADSTELNSQFLKSSGGKEAKIVGLIWRGDDESNAEQLSETFDAKSVSLFDIDFEDAQIPDEFAKGLGDATGVILFGNVTLVKAMRAQLLELRSPLSELLQRGGT
ncbi:MAG: hypothetical protein ACI9G1_005945, partial [Pirellulaceae bacterium]